MASDRPAEEQQSGRGGEKTAEPSFWQVYGNRILLGAIVLLVLVMIVRFRRNTAVAEKQAASVDLTTAHLILERLRRPNFELQPDQLRQEKQQLSNDVLPMLDRLATSENPQIAADALAMRGDVHFILASRPPTTQPADAAANSDVEESLKAAEDAYKQVVDRHANQFLPLASARFGLAAVAEEREQWDAAKTHYDAILADAKMPESMKQIATSRSERLEKLRNPIFVHAIGGPASTQQAVESPATAQSMAPTTSPAPTAPSAAPVDAAAAPATTAPAQ